MVDLINKTTEDLVKRFGIDVLWAYSETGSCAKNLHNSNFYQMTIAESSSTEESCKSCLIV
jgi:hypothetical protein